MWGAAVVPLAAVLIATYAEASWLTASRFTLLTLVLLLFYRLKVEIDSEYLKISFGIGLVRKKWLLSELSSSAVARNKWWYGWGIRMTPHGWLYNIGGLDAVEIVRTDGGRFRIGTDDAESLNTALLTALPKL